MLFNVSPLINMLASPQNYPQLRSRVHRVGEGGGLFAYYSVSVVVVCYRTARMPFGDSLFFSLFWFVCLGGRRQIAGRQQRVLVGGCTFVLVLQSYDIYIYLALLCSVIFMYRCICACCLFPQVQQLKEALVVLPKRKGTRCATLRLR